ncbi:MAG: hypothetical protein ABF296_05400, partial [Oceanococcaceae bacterium]
MSHSGRGLVLALCCVALVLLVPRFVALGAAPDGFYIDEAAIAAQVLCVAETGRDASGNAWPLFAAVLGGGQASPTLLYPAAAWSTLMGDSVASLRAVSVLHGVVAVLTVALVVGCVARSWSAGLLAGIVGLSSPWWFTNSRIFWDPVFGASWWMVALALYWWGRSGSARRTVLLWTLATVAAVLAAYAYPPVRVQMLLSALVIVLLDRPWRRAGWGIVIPVLLGALLLVPLLAQYLDAGGFGGRSSMLAIWNEGWMRDRGHAWVDLPGVMLSHLWQHLDPAYLFLDGDGNR